MFGVKGCANAQNMAIFRYKPCVYKKASCKVPHVMGDLKYVSKDHGYILLLIVFEQNRGLFALKKSY